MDSHVVSTRSKFIQPNLCFKSEIFILDDPTSSLDNIVADKIMTSIKSDAEWANKTFVISTNNDKLVEYADRVIIMEEGKVRFLGTYEQLRKNPDLKYFIKGRYDESNKEVESDLQEIGEVIFFNFWKNEFEKPNGYAQTLPAEFEQINTTSTKGNFKVEKKEKEVKELNLKRISEYHQIEKEEKIKKSFFFEEDKETGSVSVKVLTRIFSGMGGYIWIFFLCLIPILQITSFFFFSINPLRMGKSVLQ